VRPFVVEAVGDVPLRSSLSDLHAWLEGSDAPYVSILGAIERIAAASEPPFDPALCAAVRAELEADEDERQSAAARALGALEDEEALPRLIELLESEDSDVRSHSHDALRRITGCAFRGEPARWQSWYALESGWWQTRSEAVLAKLHEAEEAASLAAINELAGRSLGRHRIAAELLPLLDDERPQVRRMAVVALGQLHSPVAVPALQGLLEEELEAPFEAAVQSALLATRESRRPGRGAESR
jgi:HEAT repeat protein